MLRPRATGSNIGSPNGAPPTQVGHCPVGAFAIDLKLSQGVALGFSIAHLWRFTGKSSPQQQARLPADAFGGGPQLFEGPILDLADPFLADAEKMADLTKTVRAIAGEAESQIEDLAFSRPQVFHQEIEGLLPLGVGPERGAFVVGHRFGEFEIAVVIENGVEGDRSTRGRLQMGQVFETRTGAGGEFLRAGQMLAAVGEGLGFLLEQTQLLKVMRRQADQMALAGHRDLQGLPDPPGGVGRQAGAMADVEAVDGLHQAAHGFLQEVGVAEGMMAKPLGDVGGQADVGAGEPVLAMDVAVMNPAHGHHLAAFRRRSNRG